MPTIPLAPEITYLSIPDYESIERWKVFTNTRYNYEIKYPNLAEYEAKVSEEFPTAQTNLLVIFKSKEYYVGNKKIFPWVIYLNANLQKINFDDAPDFYTNIQNSLNYFNKAHNYGLRIIDERLIGSKKMIIVSNNASNTKNLIMYATIEKDKSSYMEIRAESIAGGNTENYKKFFMQFISTFKLNE